MKESYSAVQFHSGAQQVPVERGSEQAAKASCVHVLQHAVRASEYSKPPADREETARQPVKT